MAESKGKSAAYQAIKNLLGSRVLCTLSDGRKAEGTLVCVDRRKNIILSDCTETRTLLSSDYCSKAPPIEREAQRHLQQAMVPGNHLLKLQIDRATYTEKVEPIVKVG